MIRSDIEPIRREVRTLDFERGSLADVAEWREADAESRANLMIEGLTLNADDEVLFDMLRDEAVPPPLATQIILKLLNHPDADPELAITPLERVC
jgi:hypothetical protein